MIYHTNWTLGSSAYNMYESDEQITVAIEAPGFSKKDFEIEWKGDKLIVSGKPLPFSVNKESVDILHEGISRRPIYIVFRDEEGSLNHQKTKAEYKNGMLMITIPKDKERNEKVQVI